MKNTDPVVALLAITVLTIEAAVLLLRAALVPLVALVVTLAPFRQVPAANPADHRPGRPKTIADGHPQLIEPTHCVKEMNSAPQPHPLATLATELQQLPVTRLRAMAGTRSKRHTKAALVAMVAACG